jgi:hypothetical protein
MASCFQKFPFDKGARERCEAERNAAPWTRVENPIGVATPEAVQAAWDAQQKAIAEAKAKADGTWVDPNEEANALIRKGEKDKKRKYLISVGISIAVVSIGIVAFMLIRRNK